MTTIALIGAGGHTRSALNLLFQEFGDAEFSIYDDAYCGDELVEGVPLVGRIDDVPEEVEVFVAMGDNAKRREYYQRFYSQLLTLNLLHEDLLCEEGVELGCANQIFARSYLNRGVVIGDNNIINTAAILEHEVRVGSHNHIAVAAKLCGRVTIGDGCFIGAGATVIDKLSICDDVTVGAGAVVVCDIVEPGTYVGVPARRLP